MGWGHVAGCWSIWQGWMYVVCCRCGDRVSGHVVGVGIFG